ncbi:ABC transporter permease [Enterococcus crotali]|uniref:ABC transporter permease n=1 Tax=Enterococcus crotali TaxID=1453587 RepID=UPI0004711400|nr:ABC transporter permease [Enterococcus crotali]
MLYLRLAYSNIKKNRAVYLPFCLATIFTVVLNMIMQVMENNQGLDHLQGAESLKIMFNLGSKIIMIFTVVFTFYTHSFLMKRRKKELGLYNILGMDKKNLTVMMLFENLITLVVTLTIGLLTGTIFSKLMFLILKRLTGFGTDFIYAFSFKSLGQVTLLFLGVFMLTFLYDAWEVRKTKPIELLGQASSGEKEPKSKWLFSLVGLVCLSVGYGISLTINSPVEALSQFFIAVILVIVGTYSLFIAGSVTLLKLLKKNKKFYYKPNNFISISSMIFRMKQNGAGLATISILCTMALVTISSTVCLYIGQEKMIQSKNPFENSVEVALPMETTQQTIRDVVKAQGATEKEVKYTTISGNLVTLKQNEDSFVPLKEAFSNYSKIVGFRFLALSEYNRLEDKSLALSEDEVYVYPVTGDYQAKSIKVGKKEFQVKNTLEQFVFAPKEEDAVLGSLILILPDAMANPSFYAELAEDFKESVFKFVPTPVSIVGFELAGSLEQRIEISNVLQETFQQMTSGNEALERSLTVTSIDKDREDMRSLYGGFFFLGIIFGLSFLVATTLIIYYKQVSEGSDDRDRFTIMQKVGLSHKEVKKAIQQQILLVFFLPIVVAVIHLSFAFPIIKKLLVLFGLVNANLLIITTAVCVLIFSLGYFVIYWRTSKVYYQLVER